MVKKFNKHSAKLYDNHIRHVVPGYELFATLSVAFCQQHYPEQASVAVIGAGTGYELALLCLANPHWHFVAIDPSQAMLDEARRRCRKYDKRISWHCGTLATLQTLDTKQPFDISLCLLVLNFLSDTEKSELLQLSKAKTRGELLLSQRLQPETELIADLETTHARHLGLADKMLAVMRERLDAMPSVNVCEAQTLYRQTSWSSVQTLAQVLNYQLVCLR